MFKQLIISIAMLGTTFAHGAAENQPGALVSQQNPITNQFIGLASKKEGSCTLLTPTNINPKEYYGVTVVYTEHPKIKDPEIFSTIAAKLSLEKNAEALYEIVEEHAITSHNIPTRFPTLSVLWIALSKSGMHVCGHRRARLVNGKPESYSFSEHISFNNLHPNAYDTRHMSISINDSQVRTPQPMISNAQDTAERLHKGREAVAPFWLTLDIDTWLQLINE